MSNRPVRSRRRSGASQAQLRAALQRSGLSPLGAQQALQGDIVSDRSDRAAIARILSIVAATPPSAAEIYDYPGEYAQRFDGVD